MNKLISFIAGLITLFGGFHIYLNLTQKENISFEQSIKILKDNFNNQPLKTTCIILIILLVSLIVILISEKIFKYIAYRERKRETDIKSSIVDYTTRQSNKEILEDRILDKEVTYLESRKKPWTRINPEFHKIIVRDICDKSFPYMGNWFKQETFDLTKKGIEFFNGSNSIGFDLFFDEENHWDVFHNQEKIKKGKFNEAYKAFCIDFLPYENILHVDWEHDDYNGCITIFCPFKYKTNTLKHPFKEVRYYVEGYGNFLTRLEDGERRNFKLRFWYMKHKFISVPLIRLKRKFKKNK
jgi:hypothetical protein